MDALHSPGKMRERVNEILAMYAGDPEAAHGAEDDLLWTAVQFLAAGKQVPQTVAQVLMELERADVTRWYA